MPKSPMCQLSTLRLVAHLTPIVDETPDQGWQEPLQYRYSTVTVPLHFRYVTFPLHFPTRVGRSGPTPLHYRYIAVTLPLHCRYVTVTVPLQERTDAALTHLLRAGLSKKGSTVT